MTLRRRLVALAVIGAVGWGVATAVIVATVTGLTPAGARGPQGSSGTPGIPGVASTVRGPVGAAGPKGASGYPGPSGADYHASWAVVDASGLRAWSDPCADAGICVPGGSTAFWGGSLVVRNTGGTAQRARFTVEVSDRASGTIACTIDVDQTVAQKRAADGDYSEFAGQDPALPVRVGSGQTNRVFVTDSSGDCMAAEQTLQWTVRIV